MDHNLGGSATVFGGSVIELHSSVKICRPMPHSSSAGAPGRQAENMNNYANSNHPPRGPPSNQPPPPGNPAMTGATFFVDQKKGEINELKQVRVLCVLVVVFAIEQYTEQPDNHR